MKALIIYMSVHKGNTKKIAKAMGEVLEADVLEASGVGDPRIVEKYDIVGLGSGIYGFRHHKELIELVERMPAVRGKKAFLFSTSSAGEKKIGRYHKSLKEAAAGRGFGIAGEFSCKGSNTWGPFKLFGGSNKGRPDEGDIERARDFARGLKGRQ